MQISISGQHIDVGDSLKSHVEEALEKIVTKYFDRAIDADVVFSKENGHLFSANVMVNEGTGSGIVIKGQGDSSDVYAAFDKAAERIETQLRRYKRRIKNHHKHHISGAEALAGGLLSGKKYVISGGDDEEQGEGAPVIIAEKPTSIEKLSVSEAVMRMDLANLPALMFINEKNGELNVVYHRKDGNISWVDPTYAESSVKAKTGS